MINTIKQDRLFTMDGRFSLNITLSFFNSASTEDGNDYELLSALEYGLTGLYRGKSKSIICFLLYILYSHVYMSSLSISHQFGVV